MRIRNFLITVIVIFGFCPMAFSKEWYQLYEDGKKAIDKNNCAEGESDIREAIKKQSQSNLKARPYGTITLEYIPYFYLAKCEVQKGDYAKADLYLAETKKVDMYQSSKAAEFRTILKTVESKIKPVNTGGQVASNPPVKPPTTTPNTGGSTTNPTNQNPSTGSTTTRPPTTTGPSGIDQQALINRTLENAKSAYASGNYEEARSEANRVLMLDKNNREANKLLSQISSRESGEIASRAKQQKIEEVRRAMNRGDLNGAESTVLQLRAEYPTDRTIESLANEIQKKRVDQLQSMSESNQRKENERQVVQAYFKGNYEAVIQLADEYLAKHPASWRLHFFKGCAHAALGLLDQAKKDSQLNQARAAFRRARETGAQITRPNQISPKIWTVFEES